MSAPVATPTAPAPATLAGHTVKRLVAEIGRAIAGAPRSGLPRIPLVALHARQVCDAVVVRCRVSPHATGDQPQLAHRWAAALDRDLTAAELPQLRDDQRRIETLVVLLWPKEDAR